MKPLKNLEGWRELLTRSTGALTHFGSEASGKDASPGEFPHWSLLAAETWETMKSVVIRVEIPGMDEGDLAVEVEGNTLRVGGMARRAGLSARGDEPDVRTRAVK